jgi:hypothetical protein
MAACIQKIAADTFSLVRLLGYGVAPRLLKPSRENFMNLKSTLVVSTALLFVSALAWSKTPDLAISSRASSFSRSDIKRLGEFKTQYGRLVQMSGDVEPDGDSDDATISAPEPGSLGLLFTGLLCIGVLSLAYRRNQSVVSA